MTKKTIYIITIAVILIIISVVGMWLFIGKKGSDTKTFNDFLFDVSGGKSDGSFLGKNNGIDLLSPTTTPAFPILRRVSDMPIAGAVSITRKDEVDPEKQAGVYVRYIERKTGNVYETNVGTGEEVRVSNTTIPQISEALWNSDGKSLVIRYIDEQKNTIESFLAKIKVDDSGSGSIGGVFLQSGIKTISQSPNDDSVFYISDSDNGAIAVSVDSGAENKKQLAILPVKEWVAQLAGQNGDNEVFLTTKASGEVAGYVYKLNMKDGTLRKVLGGIFGLTTLVDSAGDGLLYSEGARGYISLNIYDIKDKVAERIPLSTLSEKCAWEISGESRIVYCGVPKNLTQGTYPDVWYQGIVSFSDNIWVYDTKTKSFGVLADIKTLSGEDIDVINPFLDSSGSYLFFTNKKDSTLWVLSLVDNKQQ